MPSLGVIMQDTVEGPRPHRLTPSFATLPLAAFSPFRGSSGSAPRSSVGPSEASAPACVCQTPRGAPVTQQAPSGWPGPCLSGVSWPHTSPPCVHHERRLSPAPWT